MAALAAIESRKLWPFLGMLRVDADKIPPISAKCVSNPELLRNAPLPDSRRGKLKGGQEGVDVDISQFLELAGFLWGAVRVSNIQVPPPRVVPSLRVPATNGRSNCLRTRPSRTLICDE